MRNIGNKIELGVKGPRPWKWVPKHIQDPALDQLVLHMSNEVWKRVGDAVLDLIKIQINTGEV